MVVCMFMYIFRSINSAQMKLIKCSEKISVFCIFIFFSVITTKEVTFFSYDMGKWLILFEWQLVQIYTKTVLIASFQHV